MRETKESIDAMALVIHLLFCGKWVFFMWPNGWIISALGNVTLRTMTTIKRGKMCRIKEQIKGNLSQGVIALFYLYRFILLKCTFRIIDFVYYCSFPHFCSSIDSPSGSYII